MSNSNFKKNFLMAYPTSFNTDAQKQSFRFVVNNPKYVAAYSRKIIKIFIKNLGLPPTILLKKELLHRYFSIEILISELNFYLVFSVLLFLLNLEPNLVPVKINLDSRLFGNVLLAVLRINSIK